MPKATSISISPSIAGIQRILPDIVTLTSIMSATSSIYFAMNNNWGWAVFCVYFAAILDGLDGKLARYLKVNNPHGELLDSIADFANFGLIPSLLFFLCFRAAWFICLIYSAAILYRLIRFHSVQSVKRKDQSGKENYFFTGVPSPESAMLACLPIVLFHGIELTQIGPTPLKSMLFPASIYLLAIGVLAVSNYPVYSPKFLKAKHFVGLLVALTTGTAIGWATGYLWEFLLIADGLYLLLLIKSGIHYRRLRA